MIRKKFNWIDPTTDKKYRDICTTLKMMRLLRKKIETVEQAESFFEAYSKVSDHAEHNIGYFANLIKDQDVRDDVLDLFMVETQIEPRQHLKREYSLSERRRNAGKS